MMWLRAKSTSNDDLQNNIRHFIDLSELDDSDIDELQEMAALDDVQQMLLEEDDDRVDDSIQKDADQSDIIHFFPPNAKMPFPNSSKVEPEFMDS